jgi:hypothetical protein
MMAAKRKWLQSGRSRRAKIEWDLDDEKGLDIDGGRF